MPAEWTEHPTAASDIAHWPPCPMEKAFCLLPCAKTPSKQMDLVQTPQWGCDGQAVTLWLCLGRLRRQLSTWCPCADPVLWLKSATSSSIWGGLWPTQKWRWVRHLCRDRPSTSDVNNVWGVEIGFKIRFEQRGEKYLKREMLENSCQNWLAFSRILVTNSVSLSVLSCLY